MKRILLTLALWLLAASAAMAGAVDPARCVIVTKSYPGLAIHDFVGPVVHGAFASQVLESSDALILVNVLQLPGHADELKAFMDSLGKPLKAIIVTRGGPTNWPALINRFAGVPVYGPADAVRNMMLRSPRDAPAPTVLEEGDNTVEGVSFQLVHPLPNVARNAQLMVFPGQKAAILYALGCVGLHMPMGHGTERNVVLKALLDQGFTWFMPQNGLPGGPEVLDAMGRYNAEMDTVLATAKTPGEAKARLEKAFPGWRNGMDALDRVLPVILAVEQ